MSDDLVKRLRDRAKQDRLIQANNEAVATALMGQRLLFDQGHRSPSNTYAVRLAMDHDNCARHDAKLAADWDEAADRIEALEQHVADLLVDLPCGCGYDNPTDVCMKHLPLVRKLTEQLEAARADAKEAEAYAEELEKELNTCRMAQAVMDNTVADLEAKLAKAVEALEYYAVEALPWEDDDSLRARTTLAEIKGESHE